MIDDAQDLLAFDVKPILETDLFYSKLAKISHFEQLHIRSMPVLVHISRDGANILRVVNVRTDQLIDHPLEFADVQIAFQLRAYLKAIELKLAEHEEGKTVGDDVFAVHLSALLHRIEALIERIVFP